MLNLTHSHPQEDRTKSTSGKTTEGPDDELDVLLQRIQKIKVQLREMQQSLECKQERSTTETTPFDTPVDSLSQISESQSQFLPDVSNLDHHIVMVKKATMESFKEMLRDKITTTFDGTTLGGSTVGDRNYSSWKYNILIEADLTSSSGCLTNGSPPSTSTPVERAIWETKDRLIRARMVNSMSTTAKETVGIFTRPHASDIWSRAKMLYGKSTFDDRYNSFIALRELRMIDNDYMRYQNDFLRLMEEHKQLGSNMTDATYHDFFLHGLVDWNKEFINTQLGKLRNCKDGQVENLDLTDLMYQLRARSSRK